MVVDQDLCPRQLRGAHVRAVGVDEMEVRQRGSLGREPAGEPRQRVRGVRVIDPTHVDAGGAQLTSGIRRRLRRKHHRQRNAFALQALRQSDELLLAGTAFLRVEMQDDPDAAAHSPLPFSSSGTVVRACSKGNGARPAATRPSWLVARPPAPGAALESCSWFRASQVVQMAEAKTKTELLKTARAHVAEVTPAEL